MDIDLPDGEYAVAAQFELVASDRPSRRSSTGAETETAPPEHLALTMAHGLDRSTTIRTTGADFQDLAFALPGPDSREQRAVDRVRLLRNVGPIYLDDFPVRVEDGKARIRVASVRDIPSEELATMGAKNLNFIPGFDFSTDILDERGLPEQAALLTFPVSPAEGFLRFFRKAIAVPHPADEWAVPIRNEIHIESITGEIGMADPLLIDNLYLAQTVCGSADTLKLLPRRADVFQQNRLITPFVQSDGTFPSAAQVQAVEISKVSKPGPDYKLSTPRTHFDDGTIDLRDFGPGEHRIVSKAKTGPKSTQRWIRSSRAFSITEERDRDILPPSIRAVTRVENDLVIELDPGVWLNHKCKPQPDAVVELEAAAVSTNGVHHRHLKITPLESNTEFPRYHVALPTDTQTVEVRARDLRGNRLKSTLAFSSRGGISMSQGTSP